VTFGVRFDLPTDNILFSEIILKLDRLFILKTCHIFLIRVIKSRRMRWEGHVARMGEGRGAYRVLVGRPEGRIPLGRPRRRWEYNIKMDLQEGGWRGYGLD
jgi:hypothetical protein